MTAAGGVGVRAAMRGARRWVGYVALVVVFSVACGLLSWWQFARLEEAQQRVDRIQRNWDAAPVAIADVLPSLDVFDIEDTWQPVAVSGEYLVDEQLLVRGRPRDGLPGFEVLVPFQLDDGTILIVDRGWVAPGSSQDSPDVVPAAPSGRVELIVRVKYGEPSIAGRDAPDGQVATINLPTIAEIVGGAVYTGAYGLLASEDPAPATAPALAAKPALDEGPHLSYALQWVLFAILAVAALIWAIRNERRVLAGAPPPPSRGRPSDAEEEDAILERQHARR